MNVKILNKIVEFIKEKTDNKVDISGWKLFSKESIDRFSKNTYPITRCVFFKVEESDCFVVCSDIILGDIFKDSLSITKYDFDGYGTKRELIEDISNNTDIDTFLINYYYDI